MDRLSHYPTWKLERIDEYTGGMGNGVFKFLDELKSEGAPREDLGSFEKMVQIAFAEDKGLAKDTLAHIARLLKNKPDDLTVKNLEPAWAKELEGLAELHGKYPTAGFDRVAKSRVMDMEQQRILVAERERRILEDKKKRRIA